MLLLLLELGVLALMILCNGLLAMVEIAVVSSRRTLLHEWSDGGDRRARAALTLVESPSRFLATVQIGITLVGILAGAFGGVTLARILARSLARIPALEAMAETVAVALVVIAITAVTLVFGELVPKRIGLAWPEQIARLAARPMIALSRIGAPLVLALGAATEGVVRMLHLKPQAARGVGDEEVKRLAREGQRAGSLLPEETRMLEGVLDLDRLSARDLMTRRGEMVWLDVDEPAETLRRRILDSGHSRFPVFRDRRDNLLGVVSIKDLHEQAVAGREFDLEPLLTSPLLVPPTQGAIVLLRGFQAAGTNFALVVDEFGGVDGLVTLHDVMRAIVGDLPDEEPGPRPTAQAQDDGSWTVDAMMRVGDLAGLLPALPPGPDGGPARLTVNGWLVRHLGRLPEAGEQFELGGHRIEILERNPTRIERVRIVPPAAPGGDR